MEQKETSRYNNREIPKYFAVSNLSVSTHNRSTTLFAPMIFRPPLQTYYELEDLKSKWRIY